MTAKGEQFAQDSLRLWFCGVAVPGLAENPPDAVDCLYVAFHTGFPKSRADAECSYAGYGRVAVSRTDGAWLIGPDGLRPAQEILGLEATGDTEERLTHFSVGPASDGDDLLLYRGPMTPPVRMHDGVRPVLKTSTRIKDS